MIKVCRSRPMRRSSALPSSRRATSSAAASKNAGFRTANVARRSLCGALSGGALPMRRFLFTELKIKDAAKKRKAHAVGDDDNDVPAHEAVDHPQRKPCSQQQIDLSSRRSPSIRAAGGCRRRWCRRPPLRRQASQGTARFRPPCAYGHAQTLFYAFAVRASWRLNPCAAQLPYGLCPLRSDAKLP
jgi:hypothetical protein